MNQQTLRWELLLHLINRLDTKDIDIDELINKIDKLVDFILIGKQGKIQIVQ